MGTAGELVSALPIDLDTRLKMVAAMLAPNAALCEGLDGLSQRMRREGNWTAHRELETALAALGSWVDAMSRDKAGGISLMGMRTNIIATEIERDCLEITEWLRPVVSQVIVTVETM